MGYAIAVARFGRLTAAGLGMSSVVIGHASAGGHLTLRVLIGLLLVGLTFHVVAFALNDLFDLEFNRTDPTRTASPLGAMAVPLLGNESFRSSLRAMPAVLGEFRAALAPPARRLGRQVGKVGPPLHKLRSVAVAAAQRRGGPPSSP